MNDNNCVSNNNGSENGSFSCGTNGTNGANAGTSTPMMTPEPKSASIPSGSRSEIHYPGVQNPSRIYESKKNRKIVRIMTVMAYMFAVSLAAIVLSLYYVFIWDPNMQIQNSTNAPEVPTFHPTDNDSNYNQMQNNFHTNKESLIPRAQPLVLTHRTDSTMRTTISSESNAPNLSESVYSANVISPKVSLSLSLSVYQKRDNISKLMSNTNSRNTSLNAEMDKTSDKRKGIETIEAKTETLIMKLSENNQTILDNQNHSTEN